MEENKIMVEKFGEVFVACDGKISVIGDTKEHAKQELEEIQESNRIAEAAQQKRAAPIAPQKGLDWFNGTSWGNN